MFDIVPEVSETTLSSFLSFFFFFTLFCSSEVISTFLSSSSLIHSSASDILLLISVIVLFACLVFNSSRSSLIDYCIFSILLSSFLIIFTIIILNSFSGSLPIYSSFIWTFVFLVFSFICVVFVCPSSFIFLTYCVWGLLFPGFNFEFFLHFGFCPPKVGPVVCVSYRVRFVLSFCLFVCFSSDGQGWVRWYSCLLMIGFVFLFSLFFRSGALHRVLLVVGWCWVLYYSGFLCVRSHYLILPRVSFLVV